MSVISYRIYLDNVEKQIQTLYKVPVPPRYIKCVPLLFGAWSEWAIEENKKTNEGDELRPMGEDTGPSFCVSDFGEDVEKFYQHFTNLTEED